MKRMNSLFAVLVLTATVAVVPAANAQTVHFLGVGSSAMYNGFAVAAYNDLAVRDVLTSAECTAGGVTCTAGHWSRGTDLANLSISDARSGAPSEPGNAWIVWVTCTTTGPGVCPAHGAANTTHIWGFVSLDSTVGVREYLGRDAAGNPSKLALSGTVSGSAGANKINQKLFVPGPAGTPDSALPTDIQPALNNLPVTAALTDIRMEDALQATLRILGNCPAAGCDTAATGTAVTANTCPSSDTGVPSGNPNPPTPCNNFPYFHAYTLGYGTGLPAQVGTGIKSFYTSTVATPVSFALPGTNDPFSHVAVPSTIKTFAVGEAPIIVIANRHNTNGLGQLIQSIPACNGLNNNTDATYCVNDSLNGGPVTNGGSGTGFVADGSYLVRNLWDQHPYPVQAGRAADANYTTANPGSGHCYQAPASAECKVVRRPLGSLFAGNLCETVNTAFTWPMDSALVGVRPVLPSANIVPVYPIVREPLSGTYNTFEYTEVRRFGAPQGNFTWYTYGATPPNRWPYQAYLSQEDFVDGSGTTPPAGNTFNPLNEQCQAGYLDPLGQTGEGFRYRGVGTGEVVAANSGVGGVYGLQDSLAYLFFSFGNVSPNVGANPAMPRNANYGYLMIDGIDPIFNNYSGTSALDPGQPAVSATGATWGELPNCTPGGGVGVPDCLASSIWNTSAACAGGAANSQGCSYPHLRDGTYPAWSELRLMCDTAAPNCTIASDPYGAQDLLDNLQGDIHFNRIGGVPDLLPFSDASTGTNSFNNPYGDIKYIRDHSAILPAGTTVPGGGPALLNQYSSFVLADDYQDTYHTINPYLGTQNPQTQHKTIPVVVTTCAGGIGTNAPPNSECGGDVGGFVIPVAGAGAAKGQIQ